MSASIRIILVVQALYLTAAATAHAEVTVTETPTIVVVENDSVKLTFAVAANYVPTELASMRGSGKNLIQGFSLYYQFIDNGTIGSVNEGCPPGNISHGQYRTEKRDGEITVEFGYDTPHFHVTRRTTVPAAGPVVKFVYELECLAAGDFALSLPLWAPLSEEMNRQAQYVEYQGASGVKAGRILVQEVKSPTLHLGPPYTGAECYFNSESGEGVVMAPVRDECVSGITERVSPRFAPGMKEKVTFMVVPFQGNYEQILTSYLNLKEHTAPDRCNASSAVVLQKTPDLLVWADHATRKIFPEERISAAASESEEVVLEAARGEYESLQVVVTPGRDRADVRLVLTPLANEQGDRLTAENLRYNPIGFLRSSYVEEIPDLLLQKDSIACAKGRNGVFWVTVKVPPETPAGIYHGTWTIVSAGEKLSDVPVRLKVWDFVLAPTPHIAAFATDYVYYYDSEVDLNDEAEAKAKARVTQGTEEDAEHYHTRMKFFADHRLYETGFGPRPNYGGAIRVHWQEGPNGHWDFDSIDFTAFDKARAYCYDTLHWPRFAYDPELAPYLGFINQYTFGGKNEEEYWYMRYWDPVLPKKDAKKFRPSIYDLSDDFTPEFKEKLLRYIKTIADHCRAKGISIDENGNGPVFFLADEIPEFASGHAVVVKTLELARLIKQADPRVVLVVNGRDIPDDPAILNLFDLWTARAPVETLARLRALGKRYGDYYMHGYFDLRSPAIAPRVQFWSYWKYNFFWIGDWAMTITPDLRWYGSLRNYANSWWFPSMQSRYGEPMSTIRFELMREGLEDHEYLWMLRDYVSRLKASSTDVSNPDLLARAESLLKRAEAVGGSYTGAGGEYRFDDYLQDPVALLALRHDVGETLEMLARHVPAHTQTRQTSD